MWKLSFKENHYYNDKIELPIKGKNLGFDLDCKNEIFLNTFEPNFHVNSYVQCILICLNHIPISEHNVKYADVNATISDSNWYDDPSSSAGQGY